MEAQTNKMNWDREEQIRKNQPLIKWMKERHKKEAKLSKEELKKSKEEFEILKQIIKEYR